MCQYTKCRKSCWWLPWSCRRSCQNWMKLNAIEFHSSSFVLSILEQPQALFEERLVHRPVQQIIEVPVPQIVEEASGQQVGEASQDNPPWVLRMRLRMEISLSLWMMEPVFLPAHHRLFRRRCIEWNDTLNEFAQPAYTWTCPSGRSCKTLGHFLYVSSSDRSECSGSTCAKRGGAGLIFVCAGEMLWIHWACMSRRHHVKGWAKWNSWCSIMYKLTQSGGRLELSHGRTNCSGVLLSNSEKTGYFVFLIILTLS